MRKITDLMKRKPWSHKYDFGHLLVIGGSKKYSGSPSFNALAALRTGVDLVTIAAPERAANIAAGFAPDIIAYPLKGDYLSKKHLPEIKAILDEKISAVAIGGGMERKIDTFDAIKKIHALTRVPFVFDADAIHAIRAKKIKPRKYDIVTPHAKEFRVLSGREVPTDEKKRKRIVKDVAFFLGCTVMLKGHVDIISDGKKIKTVKKGKNAVYLTKGGTGDTLTGICGALLAQYYDSFDSAYYAAKINGVAGELAAKEKLCGVLASDLVERIPEALKRTF
jgi:hydroxyethylthiazole kinase-like uncharacterized protein yjeF